MTGPVLAATLSVDSSTLDRQSIHDNLLERVFSSVEDGATVRPSVVAAANKPHQGLGLSIVSNNDNDNDMENSTCIDMQSVQALLAALSFSPTSTTSGFDFTSPVKQQTKNSSTGGLTTPWAKRIPLTPPTATTTYDEDEDDECSRFAVTPSPEQHPSDTVVKTSHTHSHHSSPDSSPLRSTSASIHTAASAAAAAAAYPLSLPKDILQKGGSDRDATTSKPTYNSTGKSRPCKKFPTVNTNIPGAGTRRSSMGAKQGAVKLPFVHIASANHMNSSSSSLMLRRNTAGRPNVALHAYEHAKGAWAWSKGLGLVVVSPLMDVAENVVVSVTGQGDLETLDHNVVTPFLSAVDEHVLQPVFGTVGGIISGILGGGGGSNKD